MVTIVTAHLYSLYLFRDHLWLAAPLPLPPFTPPLQLAQLRKQLPEMANQSETGSHIV